MEFIIVYFAEGAVREKSLEKIPGKSIAESCREWAHNTEEPIEWCQLYVNDRGSRHFIESIY